MKSDKFKSFMFELGLRFSQNPNSDQIEKLYLQLINNDHMLKIFDGVKQLGGVGGDKNNKAALTSANEKYRLIISDEDISLIFFNLDLSDNFDVFNDDIKAAISIIYDAVTVNIKINATRSNHIVYTINELDYAYIKSKIININLLPNATELDIWFDNSEFVKNYSYSPTIETKINVATSPFPRLESTLEELQPDIALDSFISIRTSNGMFKHITTKKFEDFTKLSFDPQLISSAFGKLGYGEK